MPLALACLAGCVQRPISPQQTVAADESALVVKLVIGASGTPYPYDTVNDLVLQRQGAASGTGGPVSPGRTVTLRRTRDRTRSTAVFSGLVPPGRYGITAAVGADVNGLVITTLTLPLQGFEIEARPGDVSLMGTLLVQPLGGRRFSSPYVPPGPEFEATVTRLFPALAAQTRGRPVHGIDMTPSVAAAARDAAAFKRSALVSNGPWQIGPGAFFASGKAGKVFWRLPGEARWTSADVGSWGEVLSLRPYRGGLLASGEEGLLRFSADRGRTWSAAPPPDDGELITVEPLPNGKVVALSRRADTWTVYVTDDAVAGRWSAAGTFAHQDAHGFLGAQGPKPVASGNRVGLLFQTGVFWTFDADRMTLQSMTIAEGIADGRQIGIATLKALPDGSLAVQSAQLHPRESDVAATARTWLSAGGDSVWNDLGTGRFIRATAFADRARVYAIAPISPGFTAGRYGLLRSDDAGKTWKPCGEAPRGDWQGVRELEVDRSNGTLLAALFDGEILRSSNEGATWEREL